MVQRIQKILSERGVCSRRKAETYITDGRVTVNGAVARLGDSADPDTDIILLDGNPIPSIQKPVYIMLYKPRGYVTTLADEKGRKNAAELVADCGVRVYPVGRLDMDSEGLLLFTNDGEFANKLMHPSHEVKKTYRVIVNHFDEAALFKLQQPISLDGYMIRKPEVQCVRVQPNNAELLITIHEGRNRQVRRMCAAAGMTVLRLIRISEGAIQLGDLPCGKWRYLRNEEVLLLKK